MTTYQNRNRVASALPCTTAALCLFVTLAAPAAARADTPVRDGMTIELGLGGSFSHVAFDSDQTLNKFGNSMLTFSIGAFINNDFAIMAHMAGAASYPTMGNGDDVLLTNQFLGVVGQYWMTERLYVSGGVGAAMWSVSFSDDVNSGTDFGFALSARAGYSFLNFENHSLRLAVEVIPEFFDSRTVVATALNLEWQYF